MYVWRNDETGWRPDGDIAPKSYTLELALGHTPFNVLTTLLLRDRRGHNAYSVNRNGSYI